MHVCDSLLHLLLTYKKQVDFSQKVDPHYLADILNNSFSPLDLQTCCRHWSWSSPEKKNSCRVISHIRGISHCVKSRKKMVKHWLCCRWSVETLNLHSQSHVTPALRLLYKAKISEDADAIWQKAFQTLFGGDRFQAQSVWKRMRSWVRLLGYWLTLKYISKWMKHKQTASPLVGGCTHDFELFC